MAGVDSLNAFPNSRMARAVRLGQSRFMSQDTGPLGAVKAITGAAVTTTANLLTAFGFALQINSLFVKAETVAAGISVAQGGNSISLAAGESITLTGPISPTVNPVTVTTGAGDTVNLQAQGI